MNVAVDDADWNPLQYQTYQLQVASDITSWNLLLCRLEIEPAYNQLCLCQREVLSSAIWRLRQGLVCRMKSSAGKDVVWRGVSSSRTLSG